MAKYTLATNASRDLALLDMLKQMRERQPKPDRLPYWAK